MMARSRQVRSRTLANRMILALLVLLAVAGLYGLTSVIKPMSVISSAAHAVGPLAVSSSLVGCPAPGTGGVVGGGIAKASTPTGAVGGRTVVAPVASAGGTGGMRPYPVRANPGQLTISAIPTAKSLTKKRAARTEMAGGLVPTSLLAGGLTVTASGSDAQGIDVEQLSPNGAPAARCTEPGSDFWFVAPGAPGMNIRLYLINTDGQAADASVAVQTDSGPWLGRPDSGISVPPHSMVVQDLSRMLHSARAISLNVTTSTGRVVAAVRESTSSGRQGTWLPAVAQPTTSQVLPGMPASAGSRELYLSVPGASAAQVTVTAVTSHGSYQPTGGNHISLLGRLAVGIELPSLSGVPGAIKITSNVPVTAVLKMSGGPPGSPGAFIGSSGAIEQQGVAAASPVGKAGRSVLVLSAPRRAAHVLVVTAPAGTSLTGRQGKVVDVPAKSSTEVTLDAPRRSKTTMIALVVTPLPGSGPVYAARTAMSGSTVETVLPVASSPVSIRLPKVRESLLTVLG